MNLRGRALIFSALRLQQPAIRGATVQAAPACSIVPCSAPEGAPREGKWVAASESD